MIYSRSAEYAIRSFVYLARIPDGKFAMARNIAEEEQIPAHFLAKILQELDIAKATSLLPWKPVLDFEQTIALTAGWYRDFHHGGDAAALVNAQITGYADRLDA